MDDASDARYRAGTATASTGTVDAGRWDRANCRVRRAVEPRCAASTTRSAPTAAAVASAPSMTRCGDRSINTSSLTEVGSPSQQLATTTAGSRDAWVARATAASFRWVGNPAPPRPRNPVSSSIRIRSRPARGGTGPSRLTWSAQDAPGRTGSNRLTSVGLGAPIAPPMPLPPGRVDAAVIARRPSGSTGGPPGRPAGPRCPGADRAAGGSPGRPERRPRRPRRP